MTSGDRSHALTCDFYFLSLLHDAVSDIFLYNYFIVKKYKALCLLLALVLFATNVQNAFATPVNVAPYLDPTAIPVLRSVLVSSPAPIGAVGTPVSEIIDLDVDPGGLDNMLDYDVGAVAGIAIVDANASNGTWWYTIDHGTTWNLLGAVSDVSARLLATNVNTRLYFQPNFPFFGSISNAITIRAWDQTTGTNGGTADTSTNGGATAYSDVTGSVAITVNSSNSAPALDSSRTPTLITVAENAGAPSGVVGTAVSSLIDRSDIPGGLDNVNDSDSRALYGMAIIAVDSNLTCYYTYDNGTTWNLVGAVSNTSARLISTDTQNRVYCRAGTGLNGNFTSALTFRAWDLTNADGGDGDLVDASQNGTGFAFSNMTDTIVQVVEAAPSATNISAAETYTEDTPLNLIDIMVTDTDSSNVTVTLTLSNRLAGSLNTGTSGAVSSSYNSGTGVWTASGAIADINALLAGVIFIPTADYTNSVNMVVNITDDYGAAFTGTKVFTGTGVNDAPVLNVSRSPSLSSVIQNAGAPSGVVGTNVGSLVDFAIPAGGLDNVTDVDSGALLGVAIIGADTTNATYYYSTNSGATWSALGAVSTTSARLLASGPSNRIYVQPASG
ncbi:MAG: hypothetical protein RLY57_648, partial [Candidatus Parcubacteria bacterium]